MYRAGINLGHVEDKNMRCVSQIGEQTYKIACIAALMADFPIHVAGTTIDRQCGLSQQAIRKKFAIFISLTLPS